MSNKYTTNLTAAAQLLAAASALDKNDVRKEEGREGGGEGGVKEERKKQGRKSGMCTCTCAW